MTSNARMKKMQDDEAAIDELIKKQQAGDPETPPAGDAPPPDEGGEPIVGEEIPPETPPRDHDDPASQGSDDTWRKRYETLSGKFNAEVPRLHAEVRELRGEIRHRDDQLNQLRGEVERLKQTATPPKPAEDPLASDVVKRLRDDYGDDFMEAVRAVARAEMSTSTSPDKVQKEIEDIKAGQQRLASESFFQALGNAVPSWEQVNVDPKFLEWLGHSDPFTGQTRKELLQAAADRLDSGRVISIFRAYLDTTKPPAAPPNNIGGGRPPQKPIAPGRSRTAEPPAQRPRYTMDDWNKLQADAQRGVYAGREQEYLKKEAEIHAALFGGG